MADPNSDSAPLDSSDASVPDLRAATARSRAAFRAESNPTHAVRADRLRRLSALVSTHKEHFASAIDADFRGRARSETHALEVVPLLAGLSYLRSRLAEWLAPRPRKSQWFTQLARCEVRLLPLGVIGVITPFNYPLLLSLSPVAAALAAGNRVLIKPSPDSPHFSRRLSESIAAEFDASECTVCIDDGALGPHFAEGEFDHLFFTGSSRVGRLVAASAGQRLIPVTLELGGRSPAIVCPGARPSRHARTLLRGKLLNAGQSCVAPDHAWIPRADLDAWIEGLQREMRGLYPNWREDEEYTSLATPGQCARISALVADARARGCTELPLLSDDELDAAPAHRCAPRMIIDPPAEARVSREEIFGPILPVFPYDDFDEVVQTLCAPPDPLTAIILGASPRERALFVESTRAGTLTFDAPLVHFAQDDLPLGGLGLSGMGQYHGLEGVLRFSHQRGDYHQYRLNATSWCLPPHRGQAPGRIVRWLEKLLG